MSPVTLLLITLIIVPAMSLLEVSNRSAVKYLGDTFLLPDGCPNSDPIVQRFYKLCLETRGGDTLCSTDKFPNGRSLTIPAFSNICSAICHNMPDEEMQICPYKGRVVSQSPFLIDNQDDTQLRRNRQQFSNNFSFGR